MKMGVRQNRLRCCDFKIAKVAISKGLIMALVHYWPKERGWLPTQKVHQAEEEWLGHVTSLRKRQRLPLNDHQFTN